MWWGIKGVVSGCRIELPPYVTNAHLSYQLSHLFSHRISLILRES